ncbi:sphingosine-1-phosphate phosphatase [Flagelloscypha sp. PMI_526]|nr:sphingosine-1-phosphate phosphatase [Flagelloscypha sp. PMI_526]
MDSSPLNGEYYPGRDEKRAQFSLSVSSSRSSSPAPELSDDSFYDSDSYIEVHSPASSDVYDATLPWWRAAIRRKLVKIVERESRTIAAMQKRIRTPLLDKYFVYTSMLGTHTFFMVILPAFFFFGYATAGRGLLIILALGVYFSSVLKDLICSPRPFAPPVTRLTIGTHHLEYGFPSSHSTNCVSIALMLWSEFYRLSHTEDPSLSMEVYNGFCVVLIVYAVSVVFGRLYTAMHSFIDCIAGVILGASIWWVHETFPGWEMSLPSWTFPVLKPFGGALSESGAVIFHFLRSPGLSSKLEAWVETGGYEVPLILIPVTLLAVNQHPQPVDDCPCFEDAIAFGGVVLGAVVARWAMQVWDPYGTLHIDHVVMPGSGWTLVAESGIWEPTSRTLIDVGLWWFIAAAKMVIGILIIFVWRIFAKSLLHIILPPVYRLAAKCMELPNRRFYTPATDYKNVPSEFSSEHGLRAVPSVIDLPITGEEVGGIGSGEGGVVKRRHGEKVVGGEDYVPSRLRHSTFDDEDDEEEENGPEPPVVKHYDADVLTKIIVYSGIAVLACEIIPLGFDLVGLGVRSSPP